MKYLLAIWDGGGATPPHLGIARLLVSRGHEVVVYGDPTLAADVAATGATHRSWPTAPQRVSTALEDDVLKDWEARTPIGQFSRVRDRLIVGPAARYAADVIAALDAQRSTQRSMRCSQTVCCSVRWSEPKPAASRPQPWSPASISRRRACAHPPAALRPPAARSGDCATGWVSR